MASKQFFDVVEVATKIIPGLTPMCVDLEKDVRNTAFQALQSFLKLLSDRLLLFLFFFHKNFTETQTNHFSVPKIQILKMKLEVV